MTIEDLEAALRQCDDAARWSAADALHWWEVEYHKAISAFPVEQDRVAVQTQVDAVTNDDPSASEGSNATAH